MGLSAVVYKNIATIESEFGDASYEVDPDTGEVSSLNISSTPLTSELQLAVRRYLGNVAQIGFLRRESSKHLGDRSIVCELILYSGSHSGDLIPTEKIPILEKEIKIFRDSTALGDVQKFCGNVLTLVENSKIENDPIVFV